MTYYESAKDVTISRQRAIEELRAHGIVDPSAISEFLVDCGDRAEYAAQDVLNWLGY